MHLQNLDCLIWWTDTFIVIRCYVYICTCTSAHSGPHTQYLSIFLLILPQALKLVDRGYRLPPPPGCPKALYELMIQCWWVIIATNPTAGINNIPSHAVIDNLAGIYRVIIKTATTLGCFTNLVFGYYRYVAVSPRLIQWSCKLYWSIISHCMNSFPALN